MDLIYVVNSGAQNVQWGPAGGNLADAIPMGFASHRLAVMPGNRFIYVTGNRGVNGVRHGWLAVIDTCDNTVVAEVDLGVGFAGQAALPSAPGAPRAYVAISQAVGGTNTGQQGGSNRIAVLNVANAALPALIQPGYMIGGGPYGTLHVAWSEWFGRLYATHRGDNTVHQIDLNTGTASVLASLMNNQPMCLALSRDGTRLFVGRRLAGDLVEFELSPLNQHPPQALQNVATGATMFMAVTPQDRVLVTATRPSAPPFPQPADGFLNIYARPVGGAAQVVVLDLLGHGIGQPALSPDGATAYVPRGGQNDVSIVDLTTDTVSPNHLATGANPTDAVALAHDASVVLEANPKTLATPCGAPTPVVINARNACGQLLTGIDVAAVASLPVSVTPAGPLPTPATFQVECLSGGVGSVSFAMTALPFAGTTVAVQCNCPQQRCIDLNLLPVGPLPPSVTVGAVVLPMTGAAGVGGGPRVAPLGIQLFRGSVRFQVPAPNTVGNLIVRLKRQDTETPADQVTVVHSGGQSATVPSPGGFVRGDHDVFCPFQNITEWTVQGGPETVIKEICFDALF